MDIDKLRDLAGIEKPSDNVTKVRQLLNEMGDNQSAIKADAFPRGVDPDTLSEDDLRQLVQTLSPEEMVQFMKGLIARSKEALGQRF